jgi:hypothetical protein
MNRNWPEGHVELLIVVQLVMKFPIFFGVLYERRDIGRNVGEMLTLMHNSSNSNGNSDDC